MPMTDPIYNLLSPPGGESFPSGLHNKWHDESVLSDIQRDGYTNGRVLSGTAASDDSLLLE